MNRKVLVAVGGVVLVLVVFVWQVIANLDSIVAGVIEDIGSDVLKTEVKVSGMAISLKEGKVGIAGLTVANPEGWSSAKVLEMKGIEVTLDIASLNQDVLVIKSIRILQPLIVFESNASGGSNMQTLLDNMNSESAESSTSEGETSESEEMLLIIDQLNFSGGLVKISSEAKPGEVIDLSLPAIKMSGIGRKKGGITPEVAIEKVSKKLIEKIISAAAKAQMKKAVEKKTKGWMNKLKGDG
jgi:hypothetical protein